MQAEAIDELREDAEQNLGTHIQATAERCGVALERDFVVETWFATEAVLDRDGDRTLAILWDRTRLGRKKPAAGVRDGRVALEIKYVIRSTDLAEIERHLLYVPEAICDWLEEVPTTSSANGGSTRTIKQVAAYGDDDAIEVSHDLEFSRQIENEAGEKQMQYVWSASVRIEVQTRRRYQTE